MYNLTQQGTTILHLWHIKIINYGRWMWRAGTSPPNPLPKLLVSKRNRLSSTLTPTLPRCPYIFTKLLPCSVPSLYIFTKLLPCSVPSLYPTLHPSSLYIFPPFPHTILHLYHITLYRSLFMEDGGGVQGPPLPIPSQTSSE